MWSDCRQLYCRNKQSTRAWAWIAWIVSHFCLQSLAITRPTFFTWVFVNNSSASCDNSQRDVPFSDWICKKHMKNLREICFNEVFFRFSVLLLLVIYYWIIWDYARTDKEIGKLDNWIELKVLNVVVQTALSNIFALIIGKNISPNK